MKNFLLNKSVKGIIEIFSLEHFLIIFVTILFGALILNNKNYFINMSEYNKKRLRYFFTCLLLVNLIIRRGSFLYYGVYDWHKHLDINFCNFTSIMFMLYGITGSKKIYNICFYMAFIGPLTSIIFPSVNITPFNYSFYSFLILHHVVFLFNIMFMFIEKKEYSKMDFINVIMFLIIYFVVIYIFDYFMFTNYNYPISFINLNLENISIIKQMINIKYLDFFIMFVIIFVLLLFAKKILMIFNYKK